MARTKTTASGFKNDGNMDQASSEHTLKLGQAFDTLLKKEYGQYRAPEPIITPTGIGHLDAVLGGGIVSSGPVMLSSTPETGKSTFAFQLSKIFQDTYQNSIVVYLDIEGSGNVRQNTQFRVSRIESFGLDKSRFKYEPVLLDVMTVFQLVEELVSWKKAFEEKIGTEFYVLIIWDSVAATPSSKTEEAEDPNKVIGLKARQLSFCIEKYTQTLKFNRITFIGIDQVRANMSIEGPYAQKEKSVGVFKDMKAASNIYSLQHNIQQWLYLSRKKAITQADGIGLDGWYVDIYTEKNKLAKSQHWVTCVFDKNGGLDKFWSEYTFLSEQTPGEKKIYGQKKMPFDLCIKKSGPQVYLDVSDPNNPEAKYKSEKFYRKTAKTKYQQDEMFRQWFDYAVQLSVYYRIINGLFMMNQNVIESAQPDVNHDVQNQVDQIINTNELEIQTEQQDVQYTEDVNPETGEVTYYDPNGEMIEPEQAQDFADTEQQEESEQTGYQSVFT